MATFTGTAANDTLRGVAASDVLQGLGGNDTLSGGVGNDTLHGGTGADSMVGGLGNDLFTVDDVGDVVVETVGEGIDTVRTVFAAIALSGALAELENAVATSPPRATAMPTA